MIFLIFIGADLMNGALALSQASVQLTEMVTGLGWPPLVVVAGILLFYVVLGAVMDELSMILLTIPIFFPIVVGMDFGLPKESVGSRAVFHRKGEESVANHLSQWVSDRENENWRVIWPVADGTMEYIRTKINTMNVSLGSRLEKPKKADYAIALGRAEAIRHLHDTFSGKALNNEIIIS